MCVWRGGHTWLCSGLRGGASREGWDSGGRGGLGETSQPLAVEGGGSVGESPGEGRAMWGAPRRASSTPGTRFPQPPSPLPLLLRGGCRREGKERWVGGAASSQGPSDVHPRARGQAGPQPGPGEAWAPGGGGSQPGKLGTGCPGSGKGVDRGCRLHPPLFQPG